VTFEDVKVPVENIIGEENQGFRCIMYNFNHERWSIIVQAVRFSRVCLEESILYAIKRKTFGKPLIKHQVSSITLASVWFNPAHFYQLLFVLPLQPNPHSCIFPCLFLPGDSSQAGRDGASGRVVRCVGGGAHVPAAAAVAQGSDAEDVGPHRNCEGARFKGALSCDVALAFLFVLHDNTFCLSNTLTYNTRAL
jgi:hypothetical protein